MLDVTQFVHDFATQWEDWYTHLQPDWHLEVSAKDADDFGISLGWDPPKDAIISDWQDIKKGSQNGFFLLLLSLGWWGVGASDQGEDMLSQWVLRFSFTCTTSHPHYSSFLSHRTIPITTDY